MFRYQELSLSFLGMNVAHAPVDLLPVRQAIAHALDRATLVQESPRMRREASGVLPPGMAGYSPDEKALIYSPARARRLLADAGHPDGVGLPPLVIHQPSQSESAERVLAQVRRDLEAIGVRLEVRHVSWVEMGEALERGTAPAFMLGWVADLTDPDSFVRSLFESGGSGNYFAYSDETTDRLLLQASTESNPAARSQMYRELERHVLEHAPIVPLYHTRGAIALRDAVRGLEPGPLGLAKVDLSRVWLAPAAAADDVRRAGW